MAQPVADCAAVKTNDVDKGFISDLTYGELLREKLLEASKASGGDGDLKICILNKKSEPRKIVRILFCDHGGGVVSHLNDNEFDATQNWFRKQKGKVDGACVFFGDLCAIIKTNNLSEEAAARDARFLFLALKEHSNHPPAVSNIIG